MSSATIRNILFAFYQNNYILIEMDDIEWMQRALKEAEKAYKENEVPVGAVIVLNNEIIGKGYNRVEALQDPTAHAEIIAISSAVNKVGNWRLNGAVLYSTIEPCLMCAGAIILSRIEKVVFGAMDKKFGAFGSVLDITRYKWNHKIKVVSGILKDESSALMERFFKEKRRKE